MGNVVPELDQSQIDNTADQFRVQIECARKAGIYDALFLAFGSLLGYVREGGLIAHDDDMDLGIISERVTKEQEWEFAALLKQNGLDRYRWEVSVNPSSGRPFWFSVRKYPVFHGMKCCHWFFFEHGGYSWHTKGHPASLIKGVPAGLIDIGPEVSFLGTLVHIPTRCGELLHAWYGDWHTPRSGGNSDYNARMRVLEWGDPKTWKIRNQ